MKQTTQSKNFTWPQQQSQYFLHTQAAVRPLSQSKVSLSAVVTALALHVGFAPTLA